MATDDLIKQVRRETRNQYTAAVTFPHTLYQ